MPILLYIGQHPVEGTGSPIVLLRHLRRFAADGWEIRIVSEYGTNSTACANKNWFVISLPLRRKWWPPYKEGIGPLRWLRFHLLARELIRAQRTPPDVVLSYLALHTEFLSAVAGEYARLSGVPLHVLVHDEATSFPATRDCASVQRRHQASAISPAAAVWFVSEELAEAYPTFPREKRHVLLPLPAGNVTPATWHEGRAELRVYYAGRVWPEQVALLERCANAVMSIGGRFIVVSTGTAELNIAAARARFELMPPFSTNVAALVHLRETATAALVSYSDKSSEMPWSRTSFPSKLIEYAQVGLPLALVAPRDTAVQRWAERVGFAPTFYPDKIAAFVEWLGRLRNPDDWNAASCVSLALAVGPANPNKIHGQLDSALRGHLPQHPCYSGQSARLSLA